jgi:hypothetical protein
VVCPFLASHDGVLSRSERDVVEEQAPWRVAVMMLALHFVDFGLGSDPVPVCPTCVRFA